MNFTKNILKQLIKEELTKMLNEQERTRVRQTPEEIKMIMDNPDKYPAAYKDLQATLTAKAIPKAKPKAKAKPIHVARRSAESEDKPVTRTRHREERGAYFPSSKSKFPYRDTLQDRIGRRREKEGKSQFASAVGEYTSVPTRWYGGPIQHQDISRKLTGDPDAVKYLRSREEGERSVTRHTAAALRGKSLPGDPSQEFLKGLSFPRGTRHPLERTYTTKTGGTVSPGSSMGRPVEVPEPEPIQESYINQTIQEELTKILNEQSYAAQGQKAKSAQARIGK